MTIPQPLSPLFEPSCQHASTEEYAAFVQGHSTSLSYRKSLLQARERFVLAYPDLREWFRAPLSERVAGREEKKRYPGAYVEACRLRQYLMFLGLHGYAQFDWEWLIATPDLHVWAMLERLGLEGGLVKLAEEAIRLGYEPSTATHELRWTSGRLLLRLGSPRVEEIREVHLAEFAQALDIFGERPDVMSFYRSADQYRRNVKGFRARLQLLHSVLYHRGQIQIAPPKKQPPPSKPVSKSRMQAVLDRYLSTRRLTDRPGTVQNLNTSIRQFIGWLERVHPGVETFAEVTRDHVLEFAEALKSAAPPLFRAPLAASTQRRILSNLSVFFSDVAYWDWDDVPKRPLLQNGDLPKLPQRVPRYIPQDQLDRLMGAVRQLECPYQRAALLIARWSGARRGEIRRLPLHCLDSYPDGTPRLHIPVGKTKRERMVPLNTEAADAIRFLQARRGEERGFRDEQTGILTRYLFVHRGKLLSGDYLFEMSLDAACMAAGLDTLGGKRTITPHRFRHTVGTQLAQRGARFRTIQKILGHESAAMSMVYIGITDEDVRQDYQAVLGPGSIIAGPGAELVRSGELAEDEVNWLKSNFFKTELELGHCLRLPQEGPCECDLYLSCAKFVTSREYAPRLRRRRRREQELVEDAFAHGWQREIERHQCTIHRLEQLLTELGEPLDGPVAAD